MRTSNYVVSKVITVAVVITVSAVTTPMIRPAGAFTEQPAVLSAVAPVYPILAVASNTSGEIKVEVRVNAAGEVTAARSVDGHPLLRQTAESTARRWRFAPVDSGANARTVTLMFVFRIMPKETAADELTTMFTPPYQVEVRHRPFEPVVNSDPPGYVTPPGHGKRRTRKYLHRTLRDIAR